jgi:hypothetical protein
MEQFPQMGKVTPAHMVKLGVDKEDYDSRDNKASNSEAAYEYAHSQDEAKRDTNTDDLGPGQGGRSQRQYYGF